MGAQIGAQLINECATVKHIQTLAFILCSLAGGLEGVEITCEISVG